MKIILIRHGETVENRQGILQGHLPGRLSKTGIQQAKKLALRLKKEKIDCIYSSDLSRAADTAKEIIRFHPKVPVKFVKELRELDLGEFQGRKKSEIGWDKKRERGKRIHYRPKNGESLAQLRDRAGKFLDKILHNHKDDTVLLVGHNGICKAMICAITGLPAEEIHSIESLKNTSINIFETDGKKNHKTCLFNCTRHLA